MQRPQQRADREALLWEVQAQEIHVQAATGDWGMGPDPAGPPPSAASHRRQPLCPRPPG
ncbi:Hypothetical predicted protein [Marmota monax]|uniref:Uncharacterized protein n=1 Tax=Marmota monax TaxID=9995 RepID=A0A5E4CYD4_MARMO|nr:Hypothetical predicted protein [Marmota monax]